MVLTEGSSEMLIEATESCRRNTVYLMMLEGHLLSIECIQKILPPRVSCGDARDALVPPPYPIGEHSDALLNFFEVSGAWF